LLHRYSVYN